MNRVLGCDESHGEADCMWKDEACCSHCLVLAARAASMRQADPGSPRVHPTEIDAATQAIAMSREIRQQAKLVKPRKRKTRFVQYALYLRPDQIVELARICADTGEVTAAFCRLAIDDAIAREQGRPPRAPELRAKNLRAIEGNKR